jgi:hypothetical protein
MAGPLGFLSLGARILEPIIRGSVWLGRNVLEVTRDVLAAGIRGIDAEIAALHRAELELKRASDVVVVAEQDLPDIAGIPEAITMQRREYSYTVKVTTIDPNTGRPFDRYINISSDRLLGKDEAKREAEKLAEEEYDWYRKQNLISSEVTSITRAAPGRRL